MRGGIAGCSRWGRRWRRRSAGGVGRPLCCPRELCDCRYREGRIALFFFSSRRRHTRFDCDWSSDVCSSDLDYDALTAGQSRVVAEEKLEQVLQELEELVGIATVKDKVKETANFARIQQLRKIGRASCRERV